MTPTPHLSIVGLGHQGELKREGSVDPSRGSAQDQDSQLNSNGLDIQKTGFFAGWHEGVSDDDIAHI